MPLDLQIQPIMAADLIDHMNMYLTTNGLWGTLIEEEKFIEYLVEQYKVETPEHLGVKIVSIPLLIHVSSH